MSKSVHITAPWPTHEEMVSHLHITRKRQKELQKIANKAASMLSDNKQAPAASVQPAKRRKRAPAA